MQISENSLETASGPPSSRCAYLRDVLSRIGDKWTIFVVGALSSGPLRFNQLKRQVEGISQRMLTRTLRALERDGFISRTVHPSLPPSVEYELTEMGRSLRLPLEELAAWAQQNMPGILEARERFSEAYPEDAEEAGAGVELADDPLDD